ncbi:MAG: ATP-binding protein [Duodenibacillus sp.]|nr:ATP-binding protein [Duodenibacillus sp.]
MQVDEGVLAQVLSKLNALLPEPAEAVDWSRPAFRWVRRTCMGTVVGRLEPVETFAAVQLDDLVNIDRQKKLILDNTEQFVRGFPANNVLLTGARGTGKSSLIRGCLTRLYEQGLRLIEIDKDDLRDLADIVKLIAHRPERFILFCDDLSFELGEGGYKALKAALDGSVAAGGDNLVVYATSNRRHLMPEPAGDNLTTQMDDQGELHPGEVLEEKLSLAERFGLWLSFYPFSQQEYLTVVTRALRSFGLPEAVVADENVRREALQFAIERGGRGGRVAVQFARLLAGRLLLEKDGKDAA